MRIIFLFVMPERISEFCTALVPFIRVFIDSPVDDLFKPLRKFRPVLPDWIDLLSRVNPCKEEMQGHAQRIHVGTGICNGTFTELFGRTVPGCPQVEYPLGGLFR